MSTDARTSSTARVVPRVLGEQVGADLARHLATYGALPAVPRVRRGHVGHLVEVVDRSGLAGRGGGWFPTGRKMHAVATAARQARKSPVVVVNDPVNLMSYVVLVFKRVFGFTEAKARKHMLEVHKKGRSVVWTGERERAEAYAHTLQTWQLSAQIERADGS